MAFSTVVPKKARLRASGGGHVTCNRSRCPHCPRLSQSNWASRQALSSCGGVPASTPQSVPSCPPAPSTPTSVFSFPRYLGTCQLCLGAVCAMQDADVRWNAIAGLVHQAAGWAHLCSRHDCQLLRKCLEEDDIARHQVQRVYLQVHTAPLVNAYLCSLAIVA